MKPNVLVLLPPSLYKLLFNERDDAALRAFAHVTFNRLDRNLTSAELAEQVAPYDVLIGGWGSPLLTTEVLDAAERLKLYAYSAGSLKGIVTPEVFDRGIAVTTSATAMAPAVAEMSLIMMMMCLRSPHRMDRLLKAGAPWQEAQAYMMGQELVGQRVGVIGAGFVGRCSIDLLRALRCEVWVHDPYLPEAAAGELGVAKKELSELMADCPVVTVHAPTTPETRHMIGARELALLQDGAVFVNTARSWVVDQEALLRELQTGRFQAALDVFDEEPLPADSPFRRLENVLLTPHVAGGSVQSRHRQGGTVREEMERFFRGEPLRFGVTAEMLAIMA